MPTSSAISLTFTRRQEKRVLSPFSGAFSARRDVSDLACEVGHFPGESLPMTEVPK